MILTGLHTRTRPVLTRAAAWMADRSERERILLMFMAGLLTTAVVWYGAAQPLLNARETAIARIELYEGLQARLRMGIPTAASASSIAALEGPLDQAVRQAASARGLSAQVDGDAEVVTVAVSSARFDVVAPFVQALEAGGATIADLRVTSIGQSGLVGLSLTVRR